MRRAFAIFGCCVLVVSSARGDDYISPNDYATAYYGGFIINRQGGQTTMSLGGAIFPRKVKVTTATPNGPVVTRFTLPSPFHSPNTLPSPFSAPAIVRVDLPEAYGVVYIDGQLIRTRGTIRYFESPPLPSGISYPLRVRAAYLSGDRVLIEDQDVVIRAGISTNVSFDGSRAISVPIQ